MDNIKVDELIRDYLDGTLEPATWEKLKTQLSLEENRQVLHKQLDLEIQSQEYEKADPDILQRILKHVKSDDGSNWALSDKTYHRVHFLRRGWFRYAAAILLIVGTGAYFYVLNEKQPPTAATTNPVPILNEISPGEQKAILTLSDGKKIELNHSTSEVIHDKTLSIENNYGQLVYKKGELVAMNTMTTPKGGQYQLTLADGTKVWLNAASSVTYPTVFNNNTREIAITGEAYFEVAKNAGKLFKVTVNGMEVEVLGTHFNINAYDDEAVIKTTLFEGAVKVIKGASQERLKPGQQAQLDRKNMLKVVNDVDTDIEIAWKNSEFNFKNTDLKTVMRQLARWYDLEIIYENGAPVNRQFDGEIQMDIPLSQVISSLEKYDVHFRLEGRKLIVLP